MTSRPAYSGRVVSIGRGFSISGSCSGGTEELASLSICQARMLSYLQAAKASSHCAMQPAVTLKQGLMMYCMRSDDLLYLTARLLVIVVQTTGSGRSVTAAGHITSDEQTSAVCHLALSLQLFTNRTVQVILHVQ